MFIFTILPSNRTTVSTVKFLATVPFALNSVTDIECNHYLDNPKSTIRNKHVVLDLSQYFDKRR